MAGLHIPKRGVAFLMVCRSLSKNQLHVISAVTFGNVLEWFEVYSYVYLAPILARLFFNFDSELSNLSSVLIVFGSGFITRPFGAMIFGRIGDLIGRKASFTLSILMMTVPTFLMGFLPTYSQFGILAPFFLISLRLLQSIPAAGEVPGSICYLYETAFPENKRFVTSWASVGNQIGAMLGLLETIVFDQYMSPDFLNTWGWRISFWSGGIIGLFGLYLRTTLQETPVFGNLKTHKQLDKENIFNVLSNHYRLIKRGVAYGAINAATFYLVAAYIPTYLSSHSNISETRSALISLLMVVFSTVLLPVFGKIGDYINNRKMLIVSSLSIIVLLFMIYYSVTSGEIVYLAILGCVYIFPLTCISSLLAYRLAHLFSGAVRYTGVGLSFNLADGIIGGFTPAISLLLVQWTGNQGSFCLYILLMSLVSLISYIKIKK